MPNLFMVDIEGVELLEVEKEILAHPNVGSIILFTRNFKNPDQLTALLQQVRDIRPDIFIAIDHEGGIVQRFQRQGFRSLPAARAYGEVYDISPETGLKFAEHFGKIMADDLMHYGIDLSLAPVLDVHRDNSSVIGKLDRAFHAEADVIVELGGAFIKGAHSSGMPCVAKHFPGHGSCVQDSHTAQPVYSGTATELLENDLKPFTELIKDGSLDAIMAAHVIYPDHDPINPAGFSSYWLKECLRGSLHFDGIVFSDCLSMKGADIGDMSTRSQRALEAGCDILIICNQTRELLLDVLRTVNFEPEAIAVQRLATFKQKMLRFKPQATKLSLTEI